MIEFFNNLSFWEAVFGAILIVAIGVVCAPVIGRILAVFCLLSIVIAVIIGSILAWPFIYLYKKLYPDPYSGYRFRKYNETSNSNRIFRNYKKYREHFSSRKSKKPQAIQIVKKKSKKEESENSYSWCDQILDEG